MAALKSHLHLLSFLIVTVTTGTSIGPGPFQLLEQLEQGSSLHTPRDGRGGTTELSAVSPQCHSHKSPTHSPIPRATTDLQLSYRLDDILAMHLLYMERSLPPLLAVRCPPRPS